MTRWLRKWWSPEEIARRLRLEYSGDPMKWVSYETIYKTLFVQGRGELRGELSCTFPTAVFSSGGRGNAPGDQASQGALPGGSDALSGGRCRVTQGLASRLATRNASAPEKHLWS